MTPPRDLGRRLLHVAVSAAVTGYAIALVADATILSTNVRDIWAFTDWLTNFAGGFVRRGFVGEMVRVTAAGGPAIGVIHQLIFADALAFSILFGLLVLARTGRTFVWITCLLCPGAAATMAIDIAYFDRREIVFHVLLMAAAIPSVLSIGRSWHQSSRVRAWVFAALIAIFAIGPLVHEAFVFMAAPAFLLVYMAMFGARSDRMMRDLSVLYALAAAGFLVAVAAKGGPDTAASIWGSIHADDRAAFGGDGSTPTGAIEAIGWSLGQGLDLSLSVVQSGHWVAWAAALIVCGLVALAAAIELSAGTRPGYLSGVFWQALFVVLAGSAPLYVLGWDWGRWIVASFIQIVIVTLSAPAADATHASDPRADASLIRAPDALATRFGSSLPVTVKIAVVATLVTLKIPECCLAADAPFGAFLALPARLERVLGSIAAVLGS
ncbi:MAG: hypothetical protein ABL971_10640 [Vicinamibacterales bacterium]